MANSGFRGVQGRYFIPLAPLLLLAAIGLPTNLGAVALGRRLPVGLAWASLAVYTAALVLSYYVTCGTALLGAGLCYLPRHKNWAPNANYSAPLAKGQSYTQQILPECNGMEEVALWMDRGSAGDKGLTRMSVRDSSDGRVLASRLLEGTDLPLGDWVAVSFPPEEDSAMREYSVTVAGEEATPVDDARVALTLMPEYPEGQLSVDGKPMDIDLVFRYGCLVGLRGILPQVGR